MVFLEEDACQWQITLAGQDRLVARIFSKAFVFDVGNNRIIFLVVFSYNFFLPPSPELCE
eukprot:gene4632-5074_t